MDSILDILQCKLCFSQFTDPVTLPCGESVCEEHTKELREAGWKCPLCADFHILAPGEKYPVNKALVAMLRSKISKLDFGPIYKKAKEEVEAAEAKKRELTHAMTEPKDLVATFTTKYRNQVNLAREEMINLIDQACDNMNAEIAKYEGESEKRLRAEAVKMNEFAKTLDSRMTSWKNDLDELVVNEPLWSKITKEAKSSQDRIDGRIKESLFIPPAFEQIRTLTEINAWTKLSDKLQIVPMKISDMRDEKPVLVRDVSKIVKAQSWEDLWSSTFDFRGFKFRLCVEFKLSDGKMYLGEYLYSQSDHLKQNVTMKWKTFILGKHFQIIKKREPSASEFSQANKGWGFSTTVSLGDIMAHPAYDAQEDMVRVEVVIDQESVQVKDVEAI